MSRILILLFILFILFILSNTDDLMEERELLSNIDDLMDERELFDNLMKDFKNIFPDNNRNAGGVQFFNHILNTIKPNKRDFDLYNTFYCAVSGSPIDPGRKDRFNIIKIKALNGNEICGKYYRCCIPCNCDIMKYGIVEQVGFNLKDGVYDYHVITIPDPCKNEDKIPNQVTSFTCNKGKTINGVHSPNGRLIVGILHDAKICSTEDINDIKNNNITGKTCNERNKLSIDEIKSGMGDIFIKLASLDI